MQQAEVDPGLFSLILDSVADGIFTVDREFQITSFNRAAQQITGFAEMEALGRSCFEVFRTEICGQDCPLRQSLMAGRTVKDVEIGILTRDGQRVTIDVSTAPLVDEDGTFMGGVESFRALTSTQNLQEEYTSKHTFQNIVSKNEQMLRLFDALPKIAQSKASVLVTGSCGSGKTLFTSAIHNMSPSSRKLLVKVSCASLPQVLLGAELFGDPKSGVSGGLERAQQSTLFLDEVGELPLSVQAQLLTVLELDQVETAAGLSVPLTARIIATTTHDLQQKVEEGTFLHPLYRKLSSIQLEIPDLEQRREDIPLLAKHFLERLHLRSDRRIERIRGDAMAILMRYSFPENVRELENAIEHAFVVAKGSVIRPRDLPSEIVASPATAKGSVRSGAYFAVDDPDAERQQLVEVLQRNQWSIPKAANDLGVHRTTLWRKVKRLKIERAGS